MYQTKINNMLKFYFENPHINEKALRLIELAKAGMTIPVDSMELAAEITDILVKEKTEFVFLGQDLTRLVEYKPHEIKIACEHGIECRPH